MAPAERYETKTKGTLWRYRYRSTNGKQSMKRGFKTKRAANEWYDDHRSKEKSGELVSGGNVTLRELAEEWFDAQLQIKATTRANYRQAMDKYVLPMWGDRELNSIGHGELQKWFNQISENLAPASVRPPHIVLSGIFKYAVRDARLLHNPCVDIQLPRIVSKKNRYLTLEQVKSVAANCGPYEDAVMFLAFTGLRIGEMAALRVGDVNLMDRRVSVDMAVADVRGKIVWDTPKSHTRRTVPIPQFLADRLVNHCEGKGPGELLFASPDGSVIRHPNFRKRVFNKAVLACQESDPDFPTVTPHDLRHAAASLTISAGANVKVVQRMLGHKDASVTLNTYADVFEDDLESVAQALDKAMRASM